MTCNEEACERPVVARQLCRAHYSRWYQVHRPPELRKPRVPRLQPDGLWNCSRCKRNLPAEDFHKAHGSHTGRRQMCKICSRVISYGITRDQYLQMIEDQGGKCGICGNDPGFKGWQIDHDHSCCNQRSGCGRCVRMLLCERCNHGLGHFKDDPEVLEKAAQYVREFRASIKRNET